MGKYFKISVQKCTSRAKIYKHKFIIESQVIVTSDVTCFIPDFLSEKG